MQALRTIATEADGAVVITAHPSLSGRNTGTGEAGSTAWNNAVRSRLYLTRSDAAEGEDEDRDARLLKTMKSNYCASGGTIPLRWRDGVFVRDDGPAGMLGSLARNQIERDFLDALDILAGQGRHVSHSPNSPHYAPKAMRQHLRIKHSKRNLEAAMNALFESGVIIVGSAKTEHRNSVAAIVRKPGFGSE